MFYYTWAWFGSALALIILGEITKRAKARLEELRKAYAEGEANRQETLGQQKESTLKTPAPVSEKDPGDKWASLSKVRLGLAVMGALLCVPWAVIAVLNSFLIGVSLGVILPLGNPLFILVLGPWHRTVYLNDIVGVLICLMQAVGGAVWLHGVLALNSKELDDEHRPALEKLTRIALWVTIALLVFEVGTAGYRGWVLGDLANAAVSALAGLGAGGIEVVIGALVLDFFVVPVLVAVCAFIATALRGKRQEEAVAPPSSKPSYRGSWFLRWLAFIDEVIMDPLRALDEWVLRRWRKQTKGVTGHAGQA